MNKKDTKRALNCLLVRDEASAHAAFQSINFSAEKVIDLAPTQLGGKYISKNSCPVNTRMKLIYTWNIGLLTLILLYFSSSGFFIMFPT